MTVFRSLGLLIVRTLQFVIEKKTSYNNFSTFLVKVLGITVFLTQMSLLYFPLVSSHFLHLIAVITLYSIKIEFYKQDKHFHKLIEIPAYRETMNFLSYSYFCDVFILESPSLSLKFTAFYGLRI